MSDQKEIQAGGLCSAESRSGGWFVMASQYELVLPVDLPRGRDLARLDTERERNEAAVLRVRVDELTKERDGYLARVDEVNAARMRNEVRAIEAERLVDVQAEALREALRFCENASEHIKDDLQAAFQQLAETGRLPYPWKDEYNEEQAAWRLATWWHGVGTDELLDSLRAVLGRVDGEAS